MPKTDGHGESNIEIDLKVNTDFCNEKKINLERT